VKLIDVMNGVDEVREHRSKRNVRKKKARQRMWAIGERWKKRWFGGLRALLVSTLVP